MQISQSELEIYRESARKREEKRQAEIAARRERAWEHAHQAAAILKKDFGARRVAVFGSLIHPELFHLRSDIDLAVWDIQDYFRAISRLMDLYPDIEFNLIPFEDAKPRLQALIEQEGLEL